MERVDLTPEQALAQDQADVFILLLEQSASEPLTGLAKRLDWRLGGELARSLRFGGASASGPGCTYIPLQKALDEGKSVLLRFYCIPGGESFAASLEILKKNLKHSGFKRIAASKSNLGAHAEAFKKAHLEKGVEFWLTH